jgi:hypothetical protein
MQKGALIGGQCGDRRYTSDNGSQSRGYNEGLMEFQKHLKKA